MFNCWLVRWFLFTIGSIQEYSQEHQHSPHPLMSEEGVAEHDDTGQHGEELPGGGDDGAGQGSKLWDAHEDEELKNKNFEEK